MFYAVLALLLRSDVDIRTSKHVGIIGLFDKEFIQTDKFDRYYSVILHKMFNLRQKSDYKEFAGVTVKDVSEHVKLAKLFLEHVRPHVDK